MIFRKLTVAFLSLAFVLFPALPGQAAQMPGVGAAQFSTSGTQSVLLPFVAGSVMNSYVLTSQRIRFSAGRISGIVNGNLAAAGSHLYVLQALKGQVMTIDLRFTLGQAVLAVWGADGTVLMSDHAGASHFQGQLPASQDYYILVRGRSEGETAYSLLVTIPPLVSYRFTPTPQRIRFATGHISSVETGRLAASGSYLYVLRALKDQSLTVDLSFTQGGAIMAVWGADGTVLLSDHVEASRFQGKLPATQDYYILVEGMSGGGTAYSLQVSIPPLQ